MHWITEQYQNVLAWNQIEIDPDAEVDMKGLYDISDLEEKLGFGCGWIRANCIRDK